MKMRQTEFLTTDCTDRHGQLTQGHEERRKRKSGVVAGFQEAGAAQGACNRDRGNKVFLFSGKPAPMLIFTIRGLGCYRRLQFDWWSFWSRREHSSTLHAPFCHRER